MLYDQIQLLDPALVASGDYQAIADTVNSGRTKFLSKGKQ